MATVIQILTTNYSGETAQITFTPCSGGTIDLGSQVLPYNYESENYQGSYSLYFSDFTKTCTFDIPCPTSEPTETPTPTPTSTETPTPTPTETETPTPTPTSTETPTPTPTETPTPEGAVLVIEVPDGTPSILFDGETYTSTVSAGIVKNQQYSINVDNGSGRFLYWEGTNLSLPAADASFTVVTVTGNTATLRAVFSDPTPTPTSTPTATSTPTPTAQPSGVIVTISEVGSDVVMSGSGSLNLTGLSFGTVQTQGGINGTMGYWVIGESNPFFAWRYFGTVFNTYPTSFGSGYTSPTSYSGDTIGIQDGAFGKDIVLPTNYVSGNPLSGSATFANKTISSMGLIPGTYLYSWGTDSITLQIGS